MRRCGWWSVIRTVWRQDRVGLTAPAVLGVAMLAPGLGVWPALTMPVLVVAVAASVLLLVPGPARRGGVGGGRDAD